ncbi:MAG: type II toxin-antitoxin system VapC family toxin [Pseudonocardia sp.]
MTGAHACALRDLPFHHRDPFDRLLIAQARVEGLTLVTAGRAMSAYDVPILPAGA